VYRALLERDPQPAELDHQLAHAATVTELVEAIAASEEYGASRATPAAPPTVVNRYDEALARFTHPVGTRSADDVAIVGREGWLFLCGGTNANLGQYTGAVAMAGGWLAQWRALDAERAQDIARLGVAAAQVIVPDKLAVYAEHYPGTLEKVGPRPIERLRDEAGLQIGYPVAELRAAAAQAPVYLRTDSHLTTHGNAVLYQAVRAPLGAPALGPAGVRGTEQYLIGGDLGTRLSPPVVEVVTVTGDLGAARIVADNRDEVAAVGGHIGTLRVFENPAAPDPRTLVMFGDSFGFGDAGYQGLAWFLAQAFRAVHFVWVPFGWDPGYVERVGAGAVVLQAAERFVARVPRVRVDAEALARETIARKSGLGLETAFGD
jgi:hypothetical protein